MRRRRNAQIWPRVITALLVATFATVASVRLFFRSVDYDTAASDPGLSNMAGNATPQYVDLPEVVRPAPDPIIIQLTLDRTSTDRSYLEDAGLDSAAAQHWSWFFEKTAGTNLFERGHALTLYKDPETGSLQGLKYNLNERIDIHEKTFGNGVIRSHVDLIRYVERPVAVAFKVNDDFLREAERYQIPEPIVNALRRAFKNSQPLNDLPPGSSVRLVYQEKVSRDGSARQVGGLEAAQLTVGHKTLSAFVFRDEYGQPHFYDAKGDTLGPQSLRFPLAFTYISSGFTFHRWHPILHEYRPHVGVDLAAHYGARVKAIADGRVITAGWCGELGRCVRIHHEGDMVSTYGHLSRIAAGLRPGDEVNMGQVIGRVGSTGLSTGPHLHFAIEKDGRYVNPLTQHLGTHHQVSPRMRELFDNFKQQCLAALDKLPEFGGHFAPPHSLVATSSAATEPRVDVTSAKRRSRHGRVARAIASSETEPR